MNDPYRTPAEREPGPTFIDQVFSFFLSNKGKLLATILVLLLIGNFIKCGVNQSIEDEIKKTQQKKTDAIHLKEMKLLCAPDHFQIEQKIGDDLWQVACMMDNGHGRLIYQEHQ